MVGVVDGGVGLRTSPRRGAIEDAKAELRQEFDVHDKRRRELKFLENMAYKVIDREETRWSSSATSVIHSASLGNELPEHIITSRAKGCFMVAASPYQLSL